MHPFPPYQYIDTDGQVKGRDYELIAEKLREAGYVAGIRKAVYLGPIREIFDHPDFIIYKLCMPLEIPQFWIYRHYFCLRIAQKLGQPELELAARLGK